MKNVNRIVWEASTDPEGRPLALVVFNDRRAEYFYAEEL